MTEELVIRNLKLECTGIPLVVQPKVTLMDKRHLLVWYAQWLGIDYGARLKL